MKKYPKIKRIGEPETIDLKEKDTKVVIQEKYDGANFRWTFNENLEPVFGSRNVEYKENEDPLSLDEIQKDFRGAVKYVMEKLNNNSELVNGDLRKFTFFAEAMHPHSLEYNWNIVPRVIGFDVYDEEREEFLEPRKVNQLFEEFDVPTARKIDVIDVSELDFDDFEIPDSEYRNGKAEGVVFKNLDNNTYAKLRCEEFFEKQKETFGRDGRPSSEPTDNQEFIRKYVTENRIEKITYKIRDETSYELEMKMMEELPMEVLVDVWEEEAREIQLKNWELDTGEIRRQTSSKCARVLKKTIMNQI